MSGDRAVVSALATAYDQHDSAAVTAVLKHLVAPAEFGHQPALWHPLGFYRLELAVDDMRRRYVLHCWPKEERRTQAPAWLVHQHAFELESLVLDGEIRDHQFQDASTAAVGPDLRGPVYRAEADGPHSVLSRTTDIAELAESDRHVHVPGHFYSVGLDRYHQSDVRRSGSCVTLARISPKARSHSNVVGDFEVASVLRYLQDPVDRVMLGRLEGCLREL